MIIGTPGSGKTTLARLFQFSTLQTLLRNTDRATYKPLIDTLTECGAIEDRLPQIVGGRLPLEAEYREFWEFPYPADLKTSLMIALLQARTVLAWLRNIQATGILLEDVEILPRADADAALAAIGGKDGTSLHERARQVELAIYKIAAALIPPDIGSIDADAAAAYRPFDVIESFRISDGDATITLKPLVIFDDAHSLHPEQFVALQRWLVKREIRVARWILTRLDALAPADVLLEKPAQVSDAGLKHTREITDIWMQGYKDRGFERRNFRKMASGMASRYLSQMDVFNRRGIKNLADILATAPERVPTGKLRQLIERVGTLQQKLGVSDERRKGLEQEISTYLANVTEQDESLPVAMLSILLERYSKRIPQRSLFGDGDDDIEPSRPLTADASVAEGARIHLMHNYDRACYFGIDTLCDASSENAEQFLQLTARLVSQSETQLIRGKPATLKSAVQHKLLRERATQIVEEWDFPNHIMVRRLANGIAAECLAKSMEGNASLGGGATAFGILQSDFETLPTTNPRLATTLKFGVAYNAFVLVPNYGTKRRKWCLIELGGALLLHHGLTLKRGGFLEKRIDDLDRFLSGE